MPNIKPLKYDLINRYYTMESKILGSGNFAKVYWGRSTANPDFIVAIKVIQKIKLSAESLNSIR
jgi:hypothetical protein